MILFRLLALCCLIFGLLCGCAPQNNVTALAPLPSITPDARLSEDEEAALLTFYDSLPEQLTSRQQELVVSYRALKAHLDREYPGVSFRVELLEPGSDLSPTGKPYDTFHILLNDSIQEKYIVSKSEYGTTEVKNVSVKEEEAS